MENDLRDSMWGIGIFFGAFAAVAIICWLAVDVFGIDVSVKRQMPQIIVTREGGYECIRQAGDKSATCRKVKDE